MRIVLCNASPLMALDKLNRLDLLASLYEQVRIPQAVYDEVVTQGTARGAPDSFAVRLFWQRQQWPIVNVPKEELAAFAQTVILDRGELEVLALAQSLKDALVLMDDEVARGEARRLGLRLSGTLGILVQAYQQGSLSFDQAELLIREIAAHPDIWIAGGLCEQVLASLHRPDAQ